VENLLKDGDKLLSNLRWGGCEYREETFSKSKLLVLWYRLILRKVFIGTPSSCDAVLQVNNRCSRALVVGGRRGRKFAFCLLDKRTEGSVSACRICRSASVKPGWSSACQEVD